MPAPEPPAFEGAKDCRERYQELIGPSFGECPACHQCRMLVIEILPRSALANRRLPIPHDEKHCFGRQIELRQRAWLGQATGALQPRGPLRTLSKGQMFSADAVISHSTRREPSRQSPTLFACGPFRSSPEIQPAINTHRSRSGQRFCPIDF